MFGAGGLVVLILLIIIASQPRQGTMGYGICKVFLELNVPFPQTLGISKVLENRRMARIQYTHTDAFGQFKISRLECKYELDQEMANRKWLTELLTTQSQQGPSLSQIASAGGVSGEILMEYLNRRRAQLPGSGVINRIAAAVGQQPPSPILTLGSATIDGRPVSDEQIERFRESIPTITKNAPDLSYPARIPDDIRDYK